MMFHICYVPSEATKGRYRLSAAVLLSRMLLLDVPIVGVLYTNEVIYGGKLTALGTAVRLIVDWEGGWKNVLDALI